MFRMNAGGQRLDLNIVRFAFHQAIAKRLPGAEWLVLSQYSAALWDKTKPLEGYGIPVRVDQHLADSMARLMAKDGKTIVAEICGLGNGEPKRECPACGSQDTSPICYSCGYDFRAGKCLPVKMEVINEVTKLEQIIAHEQAQQKEREMQELIQYHYDAYTERYLAPGVIHPVARKRIAKKPASTEIEAKPKRKLILE